MIRKSIKEKIKEYFFNSPTTKLRLRQIERAVKVPFPSVQRYTKDLEKEDILKSSDISGVKVYSANRSSKTFLIEKRLFNIKTLYQSGLIEYLVSEYSNPTITVFGSFSRGEDTESSDIDLYIETPEKIESVESFEKRLGKKLQLFVYKRISDVKNKELANNILNGVVLNGFLEVFYERK